MLCTEKILTLHQQHFGQTGPTFLAPGRVNLIGEHTDYTGGFVLPVAIDFCTVAVISPREDGKAVFFSQNYMEQAEYSVGELAGTPRPRGHWSDYPAGVAWSLMQEGIALGGFNLSLSGNVPLGAGLSSSASAEVATALALLACAGVSMPQEKIAVLCRRAENEYVGAKCGIMDQFVVSCGAEGHALLLDCRSLDYELLPVPEDVRIVICNSMVRHAHATGGYGNRRDEVEAGQRALQQCRPGIELLRDATLEDLEACADKMPREAYLRCRHILTENRRVLEARGALLQGDLARFGALMAEAHISFRDDFASSCEEVDTLVEIAQKLPGCIGARITGGGFGGCTVNLVKKDEAESFMQAVREQYKAATGITADVYICLASAGARAVK